MARKKQFIVLVTGVLFLFLIDYMGSLVFGFHLNQDMIFGLFGFGVLGWALYGLAIFLLGYFSLKLENLFLTFALAGALSNLMLRMFYGGVPDYIDLLKINFNVSDVVTVVSMGFFLWSYLAKKSKTSH